MENKLEHLVQKMIVYQTLQSLFKVINQDLFTQKTAVDSKAKIITITFIMYKTYYDKIVS